jgi:hypothetical protein
MKTEHDRSIPHVRAHERSSNHRHELDRCEDATASSVSPCSPPSRISEWIDAGDDDVGTTPMCPECDSDSVVVLSPSRFPDVDREATQGGRRTLTNVEAGSLGWRAGHA